MIHPDTIAASIKDEVAHKAETAFGEDAVFISEAERRELLSLRFLEGVARRLFPRDSDLVAVLQALVTIRTYELPMMGGPYADDAEAAAETILNVGQNLYDEFRVEE
jgi:hypothetical protein